jgi:hypothetical protein
LATVRTVAGLRHRPGGRLLLGGGLGRRLRRRPLSVTTTSLSGALRLHVRMMMTEVVARERGAACEQRTRCERGKHGFHRDSFHEMTRSCVLPVHPAPRPRAASRGLGVAAISPRGGVAATEDALRVRFHEHDVRRPQRRRLFRASFIAFCTRASSAPPNRLRPLTVPRSLQSRLSTAGSPSRTLRAAVEAPTRRRAGSEPGRDETRDERAHARNSTGAHAANEKTAHPAVRPS